MYRSILIITSLAFLSSCGDDKRKGNFELKGSFNNSKGETIYLEKLSGQQPVLVDSTSVEENGDFEFENYTPRIGFYRIKVNAQNFCDD